MPRWNLAWLLGISGVALLGYAVSHSAPTRSRDLDYELVGLVVDVMKEVDHKYVRQLDAEGKRRLVEDMVNGGLERLDQHSAYINAKDYKRFNLNSKGHFGGVGIQLDVGPETGGRLVIRSPMVDTPAYEAGVLAGDIITKIDGRSTETMRLSEAVDLITGDPGSKITLTVLHEGGKEPVELEMVRAEIRVPSVIGDTRNPDNPKEWNYVIDSSNKIAYVRLLSFSESTAADFRTVLERLKKDGVQSVILDLRTNPGGLLRSAVEISRMFLTEGRIVSTKGRNQQEEIYDAKGSGVIMSPAKDFPLVVLVNRLSASASEIVAAALQDHKRAVVIGERTYGKGSVQNVIEMEGRTSALKLTTASYWRPSGKNIHRFPDSKEADEWGVKPDKNYEVKVPKEELREFAEYFRDRELIPKKVGEPAPKKEYKDQQLDKALGYIRDQIKLAGKGR